LAQNDFMQSRSMQSRSMQSRSMQSRSMQSRSMQSRSGQNDSGHDYFVQKSHRAPEAREHQGLEALVYRDREQGKSYIHAIYD